MFEHRDPSGYRFKTYEVEAKGFKLFEGARLSAGNTIGKEVRSGNTIQADRWSQVATAYYNPMNHSYLVMICLLSNSEENKPSTCDHLAPASI